MTHRGGFTGRDLGLVLSETVGDALTMMHTDDATADKDFKPLQPKVDLSRKVLPYRPGKVSRRLLLFFFTFVVVVVVICVAHATVCRRDAAAVR